MVQKLYGRSRQGIIGSKNPVRIPPGYCQKDSKSHQKPFQSGSVSGICSVRTKIENLAIIRSERTGCQEGRLENQKKVFWIQNHAGIKDNKGFQAVSASPGTILQMFKMLFQKITGNMYVQLTKKEDISRKLAETDTNKENSKFRALFGRKQTLVWE